MSSARPTKTWRVFDVELEVGEPEALLRTRVCQAVGLAPEVLRGFRIVKKALDARRQGDVRRLHFVVHADLVVDAGFSSAALARAIRSGRALEAPAPVAIRLERIHPSFGAERKPAVVVVGAGPGGLFAAFVLAQHGVGVTLLDRGAPVRERSRDVATFHRTRRPNPESNLLFGEGGAGTFSDGKLYTRVDDPLEIPLLEALVAAGAPEAIVYDSRAHIGTDRLHKILPVLRERMEREGVRFVWRTRLDALIADSGPERRIRALATSAGEIPCDALLLATGHSARDTWSVLHEQGVRFEAKPFQLGVRVEHPQPLVDAGRYGEGPAAASLGAASYQLVCRAGDGLPAAHSFCMCPGGRIVASVNEPGLLCTNGMSNSRHSSRYANAAIVTTLSPSDFGDAPFAGVVLQRELEARFFEAGGGDYSAPLQGVREFLEGRDSIEKRGTSYVLGTRPERIDRLLPPRLRDALRRAILRFDRTIPGFAGASGVLVGVETRSSGPVRMTRDRETRLADGFTNLYPVGEGAGFAGGIMSAALDGARSALALLSRGIAS